VSARVEETVWDMFTSFAGYSFCKPHSASYALVSFKSAYLKAHYPAEFMAAVLSNGGGYYSTLAYVSEARRMGISVLGPDINESDWHWLGEGKTIRLGLQQLQDIRRETLEAVLAERSKNGLFLSLEDFLRRVPLTSSDGSVLVKSGCLDSLAAAADGRGGSSETSTPERKAASVSSPGNLNRPQLLWLVESWLNAHAHSGRKGKQDRAAPGLHLPRTIRVPSLPDLSPAQKWQQEMDSLGFVLSVHPLTLFEPAIRSFAQRMRIIPASELGRHVGRRVWVSGWPITRKEVLTREGEPMELVSFEDKTAIYETVFFPEAFRRFCQEVDMGRAYLLCGQVGSEFGAVSLTVHQLRKCRPDRDPPHPRPIPRSCSFSDHLPQV
jgi:error-prone DNA polymerase